MTLPDHPPRPWLIKARRERELSLEEATFLVEKRLGPRRKLPGELSRAIQERRMRRGLSQPDLALLVDCSQNEISKIETGERQRPKPKYIDALAQILRMPRDQVLFGFPQPRTQRILGEVYGDETIRLCQEPEQLELEFRLDLDIETDAYLVTADALEPLYRKGCILLVRRCDLDDCVGRNCIVEIDGRIYLGFVEKGRTPRVITLKRFRPENATLIDKSPTWQAPVVLTIPPRLQPD
jgi:transcriptional regulator with XRE-family HTH domain